MNVKTSPLIIKDTECEIILNYNLDTVGALTKRNGYTTFLNQPAAGKTIYGMFQFTDSISTNSNQVMVQNNAGDTAALIYKNGGSGSWSDTTGTHAASLKTRFATFLNYLFRVNSSNVVATTTDLSTWGTTNAPTTIVPRFVSVFADRVYLANDRRASPNRYPSRVYFSSLPSTAATPVITWSTSTDYFDVNPDDGDEITGLENNGNRLLIFKNRALYRWTFGQTEPDRLIGVGTSSQECVKTNFDLGITFFANQRGAYAYTGGRPKLISRKIQPWFDAIPVADVSNFVAEVDADHYYLYLSDSLTVQGRAYTNVMVVYHISLDAWTIYTLGSPLRWMSRYITTAPNEAVYFGSTDGRVYQFLSGTTDNNAAINGEIVTKEHMLTFPGKTNVEYVDVIARQPVNAKVECFFDRKPDPTILNSVKDRVSNFRVGAGKDVRTCQLRIADNSAFTSIIEGYNIEHIPKPERYEQRI